VSLLPNEWLAPQYVETPDVVADITQYIDSSFTAAMQDNMDTQTFRKLTVIAERLEYIDHLTTLSQCLLRHRCVTRSSTSLGDGTIKVTDKYSIMIGGHDFAGFDLDTDALIIYLLLTCIDTVKGQEKSVSAFEWLKQRFPGKAAPPNWDELSLDYARAHGLSRLFKQAFTGDCSPSLKRVLVENFAVVKIASQGITSASARAWEERSEIAKIDRIATELYKIRSTFTHASLRSFSRVTPVNMSLDLDNARDTVLLQRVDGYPLRAVLMDIVKHLATELLIKKWRSIED
jgi:hypothetical protein